MHDTSTASATGLLAKVLIQGNDKRLEVLFNERVNLAQLGSAKPARLRKLNRLQLKLGVALGLLDMNVARLPALTTEKEESKAVNSQNLRHVRTLSDLLFVGGRVVQLLEIIRVIDLEHEDPTLPEWIGIDQGGV